MTNYNRHLMQDYSTITALLISFLRRTLLSSGPMYLRRAFKSSIFIFCTYYGAFKSSIFVFCTYYDLAIWKVKVLPMLPTRGNGIGEMPGKYDKLTRTFNFLLWWITSKWIVWKGSNNEITRTIVFLLRGLGFSYLNKGFPKS